MAFYLSAEREKDIVRAYQDYLQYLRENQKQFPPSVFALGTALWYQNATDHKCPHDARLEDFLIQETSDKDGRNVAIRVRLLGAYDDGLIEYFYPRVFSYGLKMPSCNKGHKDWLYDEFRLSKNGHVIHEIEWRDDNSNWIIEASDVQYKWVPK